MYDKKRQTIAEQSDLHTTDFNNCFRWFESQGFNISATRYSKSLSIFRRVMSTKITTEDQLHEKLPSHNDLWQISELFDLLEAYNNLKKIDEKNLQYFLPVISKSFKGTSLLVDESKTSSRDFFFEIKSSVRLIKSNINIDFKTKSDLSGSIDDFNFNIECKRIQSLNKLRINAKKAKKQLDSLSVNSEYKVIMIDFSKVIYNRNSSEDFFFYKNEDIKEFIDKFESTIIDDLNKNHIEILDNISVFVGHFKFPVIRYPFDISFLNHFFTIKSKSNFEDPSFSTLFISKFRNSTGLS